MRRAAIAAALLAAALMAAPAAGAFNLGDAVGKALQKKDAIIKTTKALRKGFADLTGEEEYYIGRSVAARILGRYRRLDDTGRTAYLNVLGTALTRYSTRPEIYGGYHFALIQSDEINAFAAPGGFVFITAGLYSRVRNEEELAAVLAHEISHVTLRHGLSAIKSSRLTEAFTIIGTEAVKEYSSQEIASLTQAFEGSIDDVVNRMVVSGYSRSQETAADEEAVRIAYRAGYDPAGLAGFLATLRDASAGADEKGFYKTHPPASDRLKKVEAYRDKKKLTGAPDADRTRRFRTHALRPGPEQ